MLGRRPDGTLASDLPAIRRFMPFVSPRRNGAVVYAAQRANIEQTLVWLDELNAERADSPKLTLFHVVLWAIARTLGERPKVNRFISGSRVWQRDGIWLSASAKMAFDDDAAIITVKRRLEPTVTVTEVAERITAPIRDGRAGKKTTSDTEMGLLLRLPVFLVRIIMALLRKADDWGLMPGAMIRADPLFCSVFIANLGSIGIDSAQHHLWEWGNCPIFCVIGRIQPGPDGRFVELRWTYDERICDGFYAARSLEIMRRYIENPTG